jgi:hypothetical protein
MAPLALLAGAVYLIATLAILWRALEPPNFPVLRRRMRHDKRPDLQAFPKRLMGLEPTTFCMASSPKPCASIRFMAANRHIRYLPMTDPFASFVVISPQFCLPIVPEAERPPRGFNPGRLISSVLRHGGGRRTTSHPGGPALCGFCGWCDARRGDDGWGGARLADGEEGHDGCEEGEGGGDGHSSRVAFGERVRAVRRGVMTLATGNDRADDGDAQGAACLAGGVEDARGDSRLLHGRRADCDAVQRDRQLLRALRG